MPAPPRLTAADMRAYAGTFYTDEADGLARVEVEGDALVLRYRKARNVLEPTGRDSFSTGGGTTVEFARDAAGTVSGFFVTNERMRRLRFMRAELRILGNERGR